MSNELLSKAALSENEDRFERGLKVLFDMSSEKMDLVTNRLAEVAPDFARLVIEYAFGAIFARDVLDMRSRELIAISVLTARGDSIAPLRAHITSALKFGISQAEVVESMMQVSIYSGFPVVINALTACHDLLAIVVDPDCAACPDPAQKTDAGHS